MTRYCFPADGWMTSWKWLLLFLAYLQPLADVVLALSSQFQASQVPLDQFLNGNKETNVPMNLDVYYFLLTLLDIHYLEHPFTPGLTLICSPN